jgi:DUF1680 family protein
MELSLYNILEGSISSDGCKFFYSNPLQYRTGHFVAFDTDASERLPWYTCSCCPPNIARIIGTLNHYLVSVEENSVNLHLYSSNHIKTTTHGGLPVELDIKTQYPDDGIIIIDVKSQGNFGIKLRIPEWSKDWTVSVNSARETVKVSNEGYVELKKDWKAGDVIILDLSMQPEFLHPHPRIDASRGAVAIRRGPVIFAIENADVPDPTYFVDDFVVHTSAPIEETEIELPNYGLSEALSIQGHFETWRDSNSYPYAANLQTESSKIIKITAIPYARWGNRTKGGMRVWIPAS